jgi:hypothetical protein
MMNLPNDWKNIKADDGNFKSLPAGIYKCVVKQATVKLSKKGQEMLVLCFDIAEGEYKNYFMDLFGKRHEEASQKGEQAKWPNQGIWYQLTTGDFLPRFKYLIDTIEESNPGFTFTGEEKALVGKFFGGVMREEEYRSQRDGQVRTSVKCDRVIPLSKMADAKVPAVKKLKEDNQRPKLSQDDWNQEIPF